MIARRAFILAATCAATLSLSAPSAWAKDAVVTIQSTHGYGFTFPMVPGTIREMEKLGSVSKADDPSNSQVGPALAALRDGDVLVLNSHANSSVFGVGRGGAAPWSQFYQTFNVRRPPRLALIVMHACIFSRDAQGRKIPATDGQIQDIRNSLNAKAIVSYNNTVEPYVGRIAIHNLVTNIVQGKRIVSLIKSSKLRFLVATGIDRDRATLSLLKRAALGTEEKVTSRGSPAGQVDLQVPGEVSPGKTYKLAGSIHHDSYIKGNYHVIAGFSREDEILTPGKFASLVLQHQRGFGSNFSYDFTMPRTQARFLKVQISMRRFDKSGYYIEQHIYKIPIR